MHTQHVKFSTYVFGSGGVCVAVAVGMVFEEEEIGFALFDGVVEPTYEVVLVVVAVVVAVRCLPSLSFFLASLFVWGTFMLVVVSENGDTRTENPRPRPL